MVSADNCVDVMASGIFQNDNIFTAKINGERLVDLETIDLGSFSETTDPNMYQIKQLITGADIPPAHLGFEEWTSGKNTLSTENVVFAQSIVGYQKQLSNNITSLIHKIYLAIFSYTNEFDANYKNLLIALNPPRGITLSTTAENMNNLGSIVNTLKDLKVEERTILNMFWPEVYDRVIEAEKLMKDLNDKSKDEEEGAEDFGGSSFGGGGGGNEALPPAGGAGEAEPSTDDLESLAK